VPLGQGQLIGSYTDSKANGAAETAAAGYTPIGDAKLFAAGYVYNLSKRTALYTTVAQIRNSGSGRLALGGSPIPGAGGKSSGADVGVRHSF
jgi:predicted porin